MISVTGLSKVKGRRGLYTVALTSGESLTLSSATVDQLGLCEGCMRTADSWGQLAQADLELRCRQSARSLLERRPRSTKELSRSLRQRHFPDSLVEQIVRELTMSGHLNDAAFAQLYTEERSLRRYGKRRIEQELRQRGIDRETTAQTAGRLCGEQQQQQEAAQEAFRRWNRRSKPTDAKARAKAALDFLLRRGFEYSIAFSIIKRDILRKENIDVDSDPC